MKENPFKNLLPNKKVPELTGDIWISSTTPSSYCFPPTHASILETVTVEEFSEVLNEIRSRKQNLLKHSMTHPVSGKGNDDKDNTFPS